MFVYPFVNYIILLMIANVKYFFQYFSVKKYYFFSTTFAKSGGQNIKNRLYRTIGAHKGISKAMISNIKKL